MQLLLDTSLCVLGFGFRAVRGCDLPCYVYKTGKRVPKFGWSSSCSRYISQGTSVFILRRTRGKGSMLACKRRDSKHMPDSYIATSLCLMSEAQCLQAFKLSEPGLQLALFQPISYKGSLNPGCLIYIHIWYCTIDIRTFAWMCG